MEGPGNLELRYVSPIDLGKPGIAHPAGVASVIGPISISRSLSQERRAKEAASKRRKKTQDEAGSFAHIPERLADWEQIAGKPEADREYVLGNALPCHAEARRSVQKPRDRSSERGKKAELEFLFQNEQQTRKVCLQVVDISLARSSFSVTPASQLQVELASN